MVVASHSCACLRRVESRGLGACVGACGAHTNYTPRFSGEGESQAVGIRGIMAGAPLSPS